MKRFHGPFLVVCQRPGCGKLRQSRSRGEQRKEKYCSRACAAQVNKNILIAGRRGVERSAKARKAAVIARVKGLTPLEAFRLGYVRGLYSKLRQVRRKYRLVPIEAAS